MTMSEYRPKHLVDFHTHAFPEKVAQKAVAALGAQYGVSPVAKPTLAGLLATMDDAGVDLSVVAPVATRPDQVRSINEWAVQTNAERVVCFGALHPDLPDLSAEVDRVADSGLKGVKVQPNFQEFVPDDRRMWPAYQAAEGRLIVLFHSGQEIAPLDHVYAQPAALAKVKDMFPGLTMVVAHLGGYLMWEEVRRHLLGRDLYFDSSYCPREKLDDETMLDLIRSHGARRVVFATDFPWGAAARDLARLGSLPLSEGEKEAIAWQNSRDLLGLSLS